MVQLTQPIFRSDLFHKSNLGTDRIPGLIDEIYTKKKIELSDANSNVGCWRSSTYFKDINWLLSEVVALTTEAVNFYKSLDQSFSRLDTSNPYHISYWTNVNSPGSRNVLHSHTSSHFACVYYVQATGTGELRLVNPANLLSSCVASAPFARDFYFSPSDGDLVLWPAWVPHEVEPNLSNKDRINIVFDIKL